MRVLVACEERQRVCIVFFDNTTATVPYSELRLQNENR
jgi:hypothetical protein